jgi:hypothetical protein
MSSTISSAPSATATCIYTTPGKHGQVPLYDCRALWEYNPSIPAAIVFAVLFGTSAVLHVVQSVTYQKRFCWVIITAGTWEAAGFILRTISAYNQLQLGFFMPEELLILLSPIWINAFAYMILGRMIYYFLPEKKVFGISASRFALLFVCMDILAFIIQGIGGSMASNPGQSQKSILLGLHIYMGGIGIQEFFILFFVSAAIAFHRRLLALEREGQLAHLGKPNWRPLLYTLYASLALITVRIIFRLVQYTAGFTSDIPRHEAYFYCLEAFPMAVTVWLFNITHPGRTLIGPESEFPRKTRKEKKEEKRAKKEAKMEEKEERARKAMRGMYGTQA